MQLLRAIDSKTNKNISKSITTLKEPVEDVELAIVDALTKLNNSLK